MENVVAFFEGYADPEVETDNGISFDDSATPVSTAVTRVQQLADRLARLLAGESKQVHTPSKGFLISTLNQQQRSQLDKVLHLRYASAIGEQQRVLRTVRVQDQFEVMVHLRSMLSQRAEARYNVFPFHPACGLFAHQQRIHWLRREVAEKIAKAFAALNQIGYLGHVEDCYRPEQVQVGLLLRRIMTIARNHVEWSAEQVRDVAWSVTAPAPALAGHQAGAAIDWRLQRKDVPGEPFCPLGNAVDIKHDYPAGNASSSMYFPYLTAEEWETRTIYVTVMELLRMKVLASEDWHASWGDVGLGASRQVQSFAYYGPLKNFSREDGSVSPYIEPVFNDYLNLEEVSTIVRLARENYTPNVHETDPSGFDELLFRKIITALRRMNEPNKTHGRPFHQQWFHDDQ